MTDITTRLLSMSEAMYMDRDQDELDALLLEAKAEIERLREGLKPFVEGIENWTDAHGWSDVAPSRDMICDWFGPSDFRKAREVYTAASAGLATHQTATAQKQWNEIQFAAEDWLADKNNIPHSMTGAFHAGVSYARAVIIPQQKGNADGD